MRATRRCRVVWASVPSQTSVRMIGASVSEVKCWEPPTPTPLAERLLAARLPGERHRAVGDGRLQPDAGGLPVRAAGPVHLRPGAAERGRRGERPRRPPAALPERRAEHADRRPRPDPRQLDDDRDRRRRSASIWIGASFWGAMDTAFCRIYHVECRGWLEQKRFALRMLLVVLLFLAASVVVPAIESVVVSSTDDLPFGLSGIKAIDTLRCCWSRRCLISFVISLRDLLGGAQRAHALARRLAGRPVRHPGRRHRQLALPVLPR